MTVLGAATVFTGVERQTCKSPRVNDALDNCIDPHYETLV